MPPNANLKSPHEEVTAELPISQLKKNVWSDSSQPQIGICPKQERSLGRHSAPGLPRTELGVHGNRSPGASI
jgi:hypothetical protein